MWRLKNIYAENFCSFKRLELEVPQNVATLVFGNNMDDASQNSNGSGKSALIEMIALGITGDPLRKLKSTDEIIRDDADNAIVSLSFYNTMGGDLVIERTLSRKNPQVVRIFIDSNEVPIPSVNEANKYILETIGLSKEDLYSNFILSKHKYVSFLSSSDKDKKELINRFSNGVLVDESIEALQADMQPLHNALIDAEKDVAYSQGKVSTLNEQIANLMNEEANAEAQKQERVQEIRAQITEARTKIREAEGEIIRTNEIWDQVEKIDTAITNIDDDKLSFAESLQAIKKVWNPTLLGELAAYDEQINQVHTEITKLQRTQTENDNRINDLQLEILEATSALEDTQKAFQTFTETTNVDLQQIRTRISELKETIQQHNNELNDYFNRRQKGNKYIADLKAMLAGTIECPKCHHQWVVDCDMTVEQINAKIAAANTRQAEIESNIETANNEIVNSKKAIALAETTSNELKALMADKMSVVSDMTTKLNQLRNEFQRAQYSNDSIQQCIVNLEKRITEAQDNMFESIYHIVDSRMTDYDNTIKYHKNSISNQNGIITALETSLKRIQESSIADSLEPLKKSLDVATQGLNKAVADKESIERELNVLKVQEARFIEFKTYLANTKIEAISAITNQFLEAIGSDIRIAFSGITMLKSGKMRDKISITLLRDGVDCGSFGKFSQGERSRCELATILALQKLINANCEEGKGLELLVIDEVMDGTDETGLSHIFETLNNLQVTSLVISHGLIQESYQPRIIVNKEKGVSSI